ncbi:unnamed protein product [Pedinophyceae sp. YPF-701]|nr:unnamed protein product [Pedinophyceae sp. YPF-701]
MDTGFGNVLVVDNIPVVNEEKSGKLKAVLTKIFSAAGKLLENGLVMPMGANGMSHGYCFVEYENPEMATMAQRQLNGYSLDKKHTFAVNFFNDLDRYKRVPDEYQVPRGQEYKAVDTMHSWLLDARGRDQYLMRFDANIAEVSWNDAKRGSREVVFSRPGWTDGVDCAMCFSPHGNMVATLHEKGIAVWGGEDFQRLQRFEHHYVKCIEFSPNEEYLVSLSARVHRDRPAIVVRVFHTLSGKLLREFEGSYADMGLPLPERGGPLVIPHNPFKWLGGAEDKYMVKMGNGVVSVYEAPTMQLLGKQSIRLEGLHSFSVCPSEPIIACYQEEGPNRPARVVLIGIPEKQEIRQKNLFSVDTVDMFWHPQGHYLAALVRKKSKTGKSTTSNFEFFRLNEKGIPSEVMDLPVKTHSCTAFAWEPKGSRFCIVHGNGPRPDVSFYNMAGGKAGVSQVVHVGTLKNKTVSHPVWSPQGKNILLAGLGTMGNGQLEFFNVEEMQTMNLAEHFMCTDLLWDPTGRYLCSLVDCKMNQMESGLTIWSFSGRELYREPREALLQFQWRPRPPTLLSAEEEKQVQKDLRKYTKKFELEDQALLMQASDEVMRRRKAQEDEFLEWHATKQPLLDKVKEFVRAQFPHWLVEGEHTVETVTREEIISVKEETV